MAKFERILKDESACVSSAMFKFSKAIDNIIERGYNCSHDDYINDKSQ